MTAVHGVWARGRLDGGGGFARLLFGRMYEDWSIEASVFPEAGRVFCVASAGCTALALARRGFRVTAVDVNPAQIDYVRARRDCGGMRRGQVDRLMDWGRRLLPLVGWSPGKIRHFLEMDEPSEQVRYWRDQLRTERWCRLLGVVLGRGLLGNVYHRRFLDAVPDQLDETINRRLERGWALHPNRLNPYAWSLLAGIDLEAETVGVGEGALELRVGEAAEFLEGCPEGAFDGFSLSNICDGVGEEYRVRLERAVAHAAAPGAVVVMRTLGEARAPEEEHWAGGDRGLVWGGVVVSRQ